MRKSFDLSLYLVTDRDLSLNRPLEQIVTEAVSGGVTMVQLREKNASTRDFLDLARRLKKLLSPLDIPLIINDRMDIAMAAGDDGIHIGQKDMRDATKRLSDLGAPAVLLKAGHLSEETLVDLYYESKTENFIELPSKRLNTDNTHGTGCTLSSAIAAFLARGFSISEAVKSAKAYLIMAIETGSGYQTGAGHGPVHHFHEFWD